jgi:hypothetical protein
MDYLGKAGLRLRLFFLVDGPANLANAGRQPFNTRPIQMKRLLLLPLLALPFSAAAEECSGTWSARMLEAEGGSEMTGEVCSGEGEDRQTLYLTCGGGEFALRWYPPQNAKNYPPDGNPDFSTVLTLAIGDVEVRHDAVFEAMDGAMAVYWKSGDPLTNMLKSGRSLSIAEAQGRIPPVTFPLAGSSAAIETVAAHCH